MDNIRGASRRQERPDPSRVAAPPTQATGEVRKLLVRQSGRPEVLILSKVS